MAPPTGSHIAVGATSGAGPVMVHTTAHRWCRCLLFLRPEEGCRDPGHTRGGPGRSSWYGSDVCHWKNNDKVFLQKMLSTSILKQCCLPVDPQLPEVVDEVVDDEEDMFEQR